MNADRLESISIMQIKWNIAWNYVALDFLVTPKKEIQVYSQFEYCFMIILKCH